MIVGMSPNDKELANNIFSSQANYTRLCALSHTTLVGWPCSWWPWKVDHVHDGHERLTMFMIAMKSWPCLRWKNWQWWWLMIIMMLKWITCYRWASNCFFASPFRLFSFFLGVSSSLAIKFDRLLWNIVKKFFHSSYCTYSASWRVWCLLL